MGYPYPDPHDSEMNVSSDTDCTGLIPATPSGTGEENYNELYDFLPKAVSDGKNDGC
ncbi:MAG: hypothetical protein MR364_05430 [Oscillospiraceae bacterium]|nr:hypothetical protein [Oscillospiraceae bacterium]